MKKQSKKVSTQSDKEDFEVVVKTGTISYCHHDWQPLKTVKVIGHKDIDSEFDEETSYVSEVYCTKCLEKKEL